MTTARLDELGTLEIDAAQLHQDPVWLAAGRLATTTAADTLTVVSLAPGLPVVASTPFPKQMRLPTDPWNNFDLNYDRVGIHGAALRPDGEAFAIGGVTRDHERAVYVFGLDGKVIAGAESIDAAAFDVEPDFMLCPIALAWGGSGRTLIMCCSIENTHHLVTLDPRLRVDGLVNLGGDFPEPAQIFPLAHPTDDAAVFQIACGQDGVWLRAVERTPEGLALIPTMLDDDATTWLFGFTPDGRTLYTAEMAFEPGTPTSVHARPWPGLDAGPPVSLDGSCAGGAVLDRHVAAVVGAELALYRDGALVGATAFPDGHRLVSGAGDCVVTRANDRITAWRVAISG
jgi:hypothetical protein